MLSQWIKKFPEIIEPILEQLDESLKFKLSKSLVSETEGMLDSKTVNMTSNAQPLLLTAGYSIFSVYDHFLKLQGQRRYSSFLGHSLGEYTAWTAAGILPFDQAVNIVRKRGLAMERATSLFEKEHPSDLLAMIVVMIPSNKQDARAQLIEAVQNSRYADIGNLNSRSQVVFSGIESEIKEIIAQVSEKTKTRLKSRPLPVSGPFHSRIMVPGQETMKAIVADPLIRWAWPVSTPVISNLTARPFVSLDEVKLSVVDTLVRPVHWNDSVEYASQNGDCAIVSLGPGKIGKHTASEIPSETIYIEEPEDVARALAK